MPTDDLIVRAAIRDEMSRPLAEIGRKLDNVGDKARRADRHLDAAGRSQSRLGNASRTATRFLGGFTRGVAGAVIKLTLFATVAAAAAVVVTGVLAAGLAVVAGKAIALASAANESASKFDVVFGASADSMNKWVTELQSSTGIATADLQDALSTFGVFGKAAEIAAEDLQPFSESLVQAGIDLGSFYDEDPTEVFLALRSGLAGETEPLRRFGIFISEAGMKAQAATMGLDESLTESQKVLVRQALILKQLGDANGDYARTALSPANQMRRIAGIAKELMTVFGRGLLPAVAILAPAISDMLTDAVVTLNRNLPAMEMWSDRVGRKIRFLLEGLRTGDLKQFTQSLYQAFKPETASRLERIVQQVRMMITAWRAHKRGDITSMGNAIHAAFGPKARAVFVALYTAVQRITTGFGIFKTKVGEIRDAVSAAFGRAGVDIDGMQSTWNGTVAAFSSPTFTTVMTGIKDIWTSVADAFKNNSSVSSTTTILSSLGLVLAGSISTGLSVVKALLPPLAAAFKWMGDNADTVGPIIAGVVAGFLAMRAAKAAVNGMLAPIGGLTGAITLLKFGISALNVVDSVLALMNTRVVAGIASRTSATVALTASTGANTGTEVVADTVRKRGLITQVAQRGAMVATKIATLAMRGATIAWTAVQWLLNAALSANPIGLVVVGIAALIGAVILAYKNSETFRNIVQTVMDKLRELYNAVLPYVKAGLELLKIAWDLQWEAIKKVAQYVRGAFATAMEKGRSIVEKVRDVGTALRVVWEEVKKKFESFVDRFKNFTIPSWLQTLIDTAGRVRDAVGGLLGALGVGGGGGGGATPSTGGRARDTATSRSRGRGIGHTLSSHAAIAGNGYQITNAFLGGGGHGPGSGDHQRGDALDIKGAFLGRYKSQLEAMGGFGEMHGTGDQRHLHAVYGDTATSRLSRAGKAGSTPVVVDSGSPTFIVQAGPGLDEEAVGRAAVRAYIEYTRDRQERR